MKLNLVVKYRISFTFSADFQTVLTDTKKLLIVSTLMCLPWERFQPPETFLSVDFSRARFSSAALQETTQTRFIVPASHDLKQVHVDQEVWRHLETLKWPNVFNI